MVYNYYSVYFLYYKYSDIMNALLSIILYTLFGLIGIFLFKKINFTKEIFSKKQNAIYSSIFFLVFGFFLAQHDGHSDIVYQIGFGIGNFFVCFIGAIIATFLGMKFKFSFNNELFYYSLHGSIIFGFALLFAASW